MSKICGTLEGKGLWEGKKGRLRDKMWWGRGLQFKIGSRGSPREESRMGEGGENKVSVSNSVRFPAPPGSLVPPSHRDGCGQESVRVSGTLRMSASHHTLPSPHPLRALRLAC